MRKNVLALSIATMIGGLGLAGAAFGAVIPGTGVPTSTTLGSTDASVLQVAPGGIGHILVVPYFNAQNGNATVVSLVNTDLVNGKAVKIRFRGASNSDDILDFTILMSPGDMWQGLIDSPAGNAGLSRVTTSDRTCTIPQLQPGVSQSFISARLDTTPATSINDNTREGYVEIFNMADIPPNTVPGVGGTNSNLYTAIKHVNGVPPCATTTAGAAALGQGAVGLLTDATNELNAAGKGLATPTTGLMGNWTIINVPNTTTFTGSATAVRALSAIAGNGTDGRGNYVLFPQSNNGINGNGTVVADTTTADPLFRTSASTGTSKTAAGAVTGVPGTAIIAAQFFDLPDLSTPYITTAGLAAAIAGATIANEAGPRAQASILTTSLAVTSILNEYALDPTVTARTDWVFSMPTRRYSAALRYGPTTSVTPYYTDVPVNNGGGNGTAQFFYSGQTAVGTGVSSRQLCVASSGSAFTDREEGSNPGGGVFSPQPLGGGNANFCGETSVVVFGQAGTASVLNASVAFQYFAPPFVNGWGSFGTTVASQAGLGLPVLGSSYLKLTNPQALANTSGTYGLIFDHRYTR